MSRRVVARARVLSLLAALLVLGANGSVPAAAQSGPTAAAADNNERFFGAVQAIYNPDRAAQPGVQWERLIFPWSLIQKTGPNAWNDGYFSDAAGRPGSEPRHPGRRPGDVHAAVGDQHAPEGGHHQHARQPVSAV